MENSIPSPRRRASAEERSRMVALFRDSDLTQAAFARQHGLNLHTFQQWLYAGRRGPSPKLAKTAFREVPVSSLLSPSWAAEVVLGSGATVRLSPSAQPEWISLLFQNLRSAC